MDDDIGGSNESIRDVGMGVVVTEGDQTSPEESNPAKKFRGGRYDKEHSAGWDHFIFDLDTKKTKCRHCEFTSGKF